MRKISEIKHDCPLTVDCCNQYTINEIKLLAKEWIKEIEKIDNKHGCDLTEEEKLICIKYSSYEEAFEPIINFIKDNILEKKEEEK